MLNKILKDLRNARGLTQEELADIIGVERSSVGKYESSNKPVTPSSDVLVRIADYFGVSLDYLFGRNVDIANNTAKEPPNVREALIRRGVKKEEHFGTVEDVIDLILKAESNDEIADEIMGFEYDVK